MSIIGSVVFDTLVVVEPERKFRSLTVKILDEEGHTQKCVLTYEEALAWARRNSQSLVKVLEGVKP